MSDTNANTNANTEYKHNTEEQECDFLANVPLTKLFQVISTTDEEISRLLICKIVIYAQNTELLIKHQKNKKNTEIITFLYLCEKEQIENELEKLVIIKTCYKYVVDFFQSLTENLPGCTADMTFNQLMAKVENRQQQEQEQQGGVNLKLIIRNFLVSMLLLLSLASAMEEFKVQSSAKIDNYELPKENATKISNFFSSNDSTTSQNSSVNALQLIEIASSGIVIKKPMEKAIARLAAVEAAASIMRSQDPNVKNLQQKVDLLPAIANLVEESTIDEDEVAEFAKVKGASNLTPADKENAKNYAMTAFNEISLNMFNLTKLANEEASKFLTNVRKIDEFSIGFTIATINGVDSADLNMQRILKEIIKKMRELLVQKGYIDDGTGRLKSSLSIVGKEHQVSSDSDAAVLDMMCDAYNGLQVLVVKDENEDDDEDERAKVEEQKAIDEANANKKIITDSLKQLFYLTQRTGNPFNFEYELSTKVVNISYNQTVIFFIVKYLEYYRDIIIDSLKLELQKIKREDDPNWIKSMSEDQQHLLKALYSFSDKIEYLIIGLQRIDAGFQLCLEERDSLKALELAMKNIHEANLWFVEALNKTSPLSDVKDELIKKITEEEKEEKREAANVFWGNFHEAVRRNVEGV